MEADTNRAVGEHLRRLRKQRGLSLADVEATSGGEFKASVLGAYERGERAITAQRLERLGEIYDLPLRAMLPSDGGSRTVEESSGVALDVPALEATSDPVGRTVARYVRAVQGQRGDWTGRVIRIRSEDVWVLAAATDRTPPEFVALLDELGLRAY